MAAAKKGRAPRPVPGGREAQAKATVTAMTVFDILVRDESVGRLAVGNVPLAEKMEARKQTGFNWLEVLGQVGAGGDVVTMAVFVWLAKRASGEATLTWREFMGSWDDTVRADEIQFDPIAADEVEGADDPQP